MQIEHLSKITNGGDTIFGDKILVRNFKKKILKIWVLKIGHQIM